jgi:hypothetical protein
MDSISNSGVSLILNPDITNAINDNQHQHDLSTCEEEFENQEEIQQMLANAFDSQSLSNTDNDAHVFDDDDEYEEQIPAQKYFYFPCCFNLFVFVFLSSSIEHVAQSQNDVLLQQENQTLRHRLSEYAINEEIYRKKILEHEQETNELNEKYEQKYFSLRLEYETKIEQLTTKTSEQQIEIFTLKQMYDTIADEKFHTDEQINNMRFNEQNLQEKLDKLQMEYDQLSRSNKKPLMMHVLTQTVKSIDEKDTQISSFFFSRRFHKKSKN